MRVPNVEYEEPDDGGTATENAPRGGQQDTLPPSNRGTDHPGETARGRRGERAEPRKKGREGRGARTEQGAKGWRRLGNGRSEVPAKPAKGRGRRRRASGAPCTAVPTDLQRARHRVPTRSSRVTRGSSRGGRREGGRFLPGPWERGTEGGVVGVGSQGRRRIQ